MNIEQRHWERRSKIPIWLQSEYERYKIEISDRDWSEIDSISMTPAERLLFFERIVFNLEAVEFWSAIDKRRHDLEQFWKQELGLAEEERINHVGHLLEMTLALSRGQSELEQLTESERNKTGLAISKGCAAVLGNLQSLRRLVGQEHGPPPELAFALSHEATQIITRLKADADLWSQSKPIVKRPNAKGAEIRYFVRSVAGYFGHFFDQRLYAATASLARSVFGSGVSTERVREIIRSDS